VTAPFGRKVSGWAREIVAKRVLIVAAAVGVADFLVQTGLIPDEMTEQTDTLVSRGIYVIGLIGGIFWARAGVTPSNPDLQPKTNTGVPLVPADPGADTHGRHAAPVDPNGPVL